MTAALYVAKAYESGEAEADPVQSASFDQTTTDEDGLTSGAWHQFSSSKANVYRGHGFFFRLYVLFLFFLWLYVLFLLRCESKCFLYSFCYIYPLWIIWLCISFLDIETGLIKNYYFKRIINQSCKTSSVQQQRTRYHNDFCRCTTTMKFRSTRSSIDFRTTGFISEFRLSAEFIAQIKEFHKS